jgi:hypothetical protein
MRSRAWLILTTAVAATLLTAQPAVAAQAVVPFSADSGDRCRHGVTEGTLDWVVGPVIRPTVEVEGYLSDGAFASVCGVDGLYSLVTFTAYHGKDLVDSEVSKVDDGKVELSFGLSDPTGVTGIDRVVVQVCRFNNSPIGISYCGLAQEYQAP